MHISYVLGTLTFCPLLSYHSCAVRDNGVNVTVLVRTIQIDLSCMHLISLILGYRKLHMIIFFLLTLDMLLIV